MCFLIRNTPDITTFESDYVYECNTNIKIFSSDITSSEKNLCFKSYFD